jgi:drug/metabolite transporter (DMT)-like permease
VGGRWRARGPADAPSHPPMTDRPTAAARPWRLQFVVLSSIWGASFLFIKEALHALAPVDVALFRVALGAAVLAAVLAVRREAPPRDRRVWGHLAVVAAVGNAAPFALLAYGETHISSVLTGIWNATTPLMTMLFATLVLPDERPTARRVAGLLGGFAGVVVVLGPWRHLGGGQLAGSVMCLGAAVCYGIAFPYTRRFLAGRHESGVALAGGQLTCAALELAVVTIFVGGAPGAVTVRAGLSLLALGALGTGLAYILNYAVVRRAGATTASTVTYLVPVWATLLGVLVLSEPLSWNEPVGAAVVLASVAASQRTLRRRRAVRPAAVAPAAPAPVE